MTLKILDFAKKHGVSLNWLIEGELKYLRSMTEKRKAPPPPAPMVERFVAGFRNLSPSAQHVLAMAM